MHDLNANDAVSVDVTKNMDMPVMKAQDAVDGETIVIEE